MSREQLRCKLYEQYLSLQSARDRYQRALTILREAERRYTETFELHERMFRAERENRRK